MENRLLSCEILGQLLLSRCSCCVFIRLAAQYLWVISDTKKYQEIPWNKGVDWLFLKCGQVGERNGSSLVPGCFPAKRSSVMDTSWFSLSFHYSIQVSRADASDKFRKNTLDIFGFSLFWPSLSMPWTFPQFFPDRPLFWQRAQCWHHRLPCLGLTIHSASTLSLSGTF